MVKLATAREFRSYGTRQARHRCEYINAGLYIFAAILLSGGFLAQFSAASSSSGLAILLISLAIFAFVQAHDLAAHLAGIDFRLSLLFLDLQLAFVEIAVPAVEFLGSVLAFVAFLLLFIAREKADGEKLRRYSARMLVAGPALWFLGSIHDLCQVYERSGGHVQVLQKLVQIPFFAGSLLFLVGGIYNSQEIAGESWIWLSLGGSLCFILGGLLNVVRVFKLQQMDGIRLEKLRGRAQERLTRDRESSAPLIVEEHRTPPLSTPYKDVLLGPSS
ncbi:polypyrimidine tract-binding-like protein [Wolffia australiana]